MKTVKQMFFCKQKNMKTVKQMFFTKSRSLCKQRFNKLSTQTLVEDYYKT